MDSNQKQPQALPPENRREPIIPEIKATPSILLFFLACLLISFYFLGKLLFPFFSIIVLASVVTGVSNPAYRFFCRRMPATAASLLTCLIVFFFLFIPMVFFVGVLSQEAYGLYLMGKSAMLSDQIKAIIAGSTIIDKLNQYLIHFDFQLTGDMFNKAISQMGKTVGLFLYQQAQNIISNLLNLIVNFFLMLLIIYFLLMDGQRLIAFIKDLSPLPEDQDEKLIDKFTEMAGAIMVGNGLCGIIQGVIGGIVFAVFGLQSPFLWGAIMSILAFLPILGIGLVFIPAALFLFLKGQIGTSIFFLVFYVVLSGSIEYLFKPKLVGKRVKMHTLLVFFSIIGGLKLFGILGIIYGPLVVTAFLTLTDIYHANYRNLIEFKQ